MTLSLIKVIETYTNKVTFFTSFFKTEVKVIMNYLS